MKRCYFAVGLKLRKLASEVEACRSRFAGSAKDVGSRPIEAQLITRLCGGAKSRLTVFGGSK